MPPASAEIDAAPACWPRVRLWAGSLAAWYLPLIYRFRPRSVPGRRVRLRADWSLETGSELDEGELVALLIEACDHLERDHLGRRGDRDPAVWSDAATCESVSAWQDLLAGERGRLPGGVRARFPRGTPAPQRFGLPGSLRAEEYYAQLSDGANEALSLWGPYGPPASSSRPHEPEAGSGAPGTGRRPQDGGRGESEPQAGGERPGGPAGSGLDPAARAGIDLAGSQAPAGPELAAVVQQVRAEMRRAEPGSLPADLERRVARGAAPQVAWRRELARALGRRPGRHDYSLLPRPNYARLLATGAVGSRLQAGGPRVTVLRDSSASMDAGLQAQVLAEVEELARHDPDLAVVDADTEIHAVRRGVAGLDRIRGGGGTDMLAAAWEAWRRTRPDCLVVLTDGLTPWSESSAEPPGTTWVVIAAGPVYVPSRFRSVVRVRSPDPAA